MKKGKKPASHHRGGSIRLAAKIKTALEPKIPDQVSS